jgi:hypothetical protein
MCAHGHVYDYMKQNYVKASTKIISKEQADQLWREAERNVTSQNYGQAIL